MSEDMIIPGDEAYLSFGGWAKAMPNPPALHERRRFIIDAECTGGGVKASQNGERSVRSLSILRVKEVEGAVVPPADVDENQGELFPEDEVTGDGDGEGGTVVDMPERSSR